MLTRRYKLTPTPGKGDQPAIRRYRLTRMEELADAEEGRDGGTVEGDERRTMRHMPPSVPGPEHSRQHL